MKHICCYTSVFKAFEQVYPHETGINITIPTLRWTHGGLLYRKDRQDTYHVRKYFYPNIRLMFNMTLLTCLTEFVIYSLQPF